MNVTSLFEFVKKSKSKALPMGTLREMMLRKR